MTENEQEFYTCCPHCTTMFRVLSTAIEASQGWVKCGRCHKVFDCREKEIDAGEFAKMAAQELADKEASDSQVSSVESKTALSVEEDSQLAIFGNPPPAPEESKKAPGPIPPQEPAQKTSGIKTGLDNLVIEPGKLKRQDSEKGQPSDKVTEREDKSSETVHGSLRIDDDKNPEEPQLVADNRQKQQSAQGKTHSNENTEGAKNPWLSKTIQAGAQSWKKEKNRFKPRRKYSGVIISILLLALLLWQVAIVNYTKLSTYGILSAPLNLVCAVLSCNSTTPRTTNDLEILYANLRRHPQRPNVIRISAKLINYSNDEIGLPVVRLDLAGDTDSTIASRLIDLANHPQYVDPPVSQLAPGQDVTMVFNIENPDPAVQGFKLGLAGSAQ